MKYVNCVFNRCCKFNHTKEPSVLIVKYVVCDFRQQQYYLKKICE